MYVKVIKAQLFWMLLKKWNYLNLHNFQVNLKKRGEKILEYLVEFFLLHLKINFKEFYLVDVFGLL